MTTRLPILLATVSEEPSRRAVVSASLSTGKERAHFQRRLALSWGLVGALGAVFWVAILASGASADAASQGYSSLLHAAASLIAVGSAIALRWTPRGARLLGLADIGITLVVNLGWALALASGHDTGQAALITLLASTYTLGARAALVPSPPLRTALIGAAALVPALATHMAEASSSRALLAGWAFVAVACTAAVSHVVYGLEKEVERVRMLGAYVVEEQLGAGAMGVVYRARHPLLKRPVAVKVLTHASQDAEQRFAREVETMARLDHPNNITIFDYGRTDEGFFFYAMEFVDGLSLQELVSEGGPVPEGRAIDLLIQVCGALAEVHATGLVHRDIKPANIMLTGRQGRGDVVKVLDFGLAKDLTEESLGSTGVVGTPHYLSPEMIAAPERVDARADIYALGATAFFLLTGQEAFGGRNVVELCSHHLHTPPRRPSSLRSGLTDALDALVVRCLSKDPEDRPRSAAQLAAELQSCRGEAWTDSNAQQWWRERAEMKHLEAS